MITNVGELLKKERLRKNLSLDQVEKDTRIRKQNLEAIENEKWEIFSSRTYIQGIIRGYGAYLGLDEEKLLAYFRREYERHEQLKFKEKATSGQFTPFTKRILRLTITFLVVVFTLYFGYQLSLFLSPPKLEILEPTKTQFKREDKITIKGKVEDDTTVHVNGEQVFPDEHFVFTYNLALAEKLNKAVIKATGANGKETVIEKVYEKLK